MDDLDNLENNDVPLLPVRIVVEWDEPDYGWSSQASDPVGSPPVAVEIPGDMLAYPEDVPDYLSDLYGFLVKDWRLA